MKVLQSLRSVFYEKGVGDYLISLTSNSKEVLFENFKLEIYDCLVWQPENSSHNSFVLVSFILFACIIKELNNKFVKINVSLFT